MRYVKTPAISVFTSWGWWGKQFKRTSRGLDLDSFIEERFEIMWGLGEVESSHPSASGSLKRFYFRAGRRPEGGEVIVGGFS